MRISDWSSDVCSSDLRCTQAEGAGAGDGGQADGAHRLSACADEIRAGHHAAGTGRRTERGPGEAGPVGRDRSEEHTSELQSLMRTSYAVFCLKKKNKTKHTNSTHIHNRLQLNTTYYTLPICNIQNIITKYTYVTRYKLGQ